MAQAVAMTVIPGGNSIKVPRLQPQTSGTSLLISRIKCSSTTDSDESRSSTSSNKQINLEESSGWKNGVSRVVLSTLAAGFLLASPAVLGGSAMAAQSGGRIGGQSFRSTPRMAPRSAPPPRSAPRINNSRTNVYINPPAYGYGGSPFFGGWGWSPFSYFYAPAAPAVTVGVGGGFDFVPIIVGLFLVGWISRVFRNRNQDDDDFD